MKVCVGASRLVILTKRYAFKLPYLFSWRRFLRGLLSNLSERSWWRITHDNRLCPIVVSLPGGFLNVMLRAQELSPTTKVMFKLFIDLPVENKDDSFGYIGDRVVVIDYGD